MSYLLREKELELTRYQNALTRLHNSILADERSGSVLPDIIGDKWEEYQRLNDEFRDKVADYNAKVAETYRRSGSSLTSSRRQWRSSH